MKRFCYIIALSFASSISWGQVNLVPNPSFENYSSCPTMIGQLNKAIPWYNPTGGSSDYFNVCGIDSTGISDLRVPNNFFGYQQARTGNAYSGIGFNPGTREYIAVKLDSILKTNQKYCVSFYVSLHNCAKYSSSSMGAYFSNTKITNYSTIYRLYVVPQIENSATRLLSDTVNWMLVSGSFIANGGEQFMTIGNFLSDTNSVMDPTYPTNISAYASYYIEDVSVSECSDAPPILVEDLLIPTLLSGNQIFVIKGLEGTNELFLYNSLGQVVYKNTNYKNDLNTIEFETGIYYYYLKLNSGEVYKDKLCIVH